MSKSQVSNPRPADLVICIQTHSIDTSSELEFILIDKFLSKSQHSNSINLKSFWTFHFAQTRRRLKIKYFSHLRKKKSFDTAGIKPSSSEQVLEPSHLKSIWTFRFAWTERKLERNIFSSKEEQLTKLSTDWITSILHTISINETSFLKQSEQLKSVLPINHS